MTRRLIGAVTGGIACLAMLLAGCGDASGPPSAELQARARAAGFDADLVYVTQVEGYHAAAGGAGVYGDSGYQAVYATGQGSDLRLTVERRGLTAQTCPDLPIPAAEPAGAVVTCTADGDGWRRSAGDRQEYALPRGDVLVRASGPAGTSASVLRAAVTDARPATSDELEALLPPAQGTPVERGDISGDNAPDNSVGAGG